MVSPALPLATVLMVSPPLRELHASLLASLLAPLLAPLLTPLLASLFTSLLLRGTAPRSRPAGGRP